MEIKFANIEERDTDFAIIRAFKNNSKVRDLFFKQINRNGELIKIFHSLTQKEIDGHYGESDIVFICKDEQGTFAIFIEDKIAAGPQPRQRDRYDIRAKKLKEQKEYDGESYIFLCAPQSYLDSDKSEDYEHQISHESIMCLVEDELDKEIFNNSINPNKQKYNPVKNDAVTKFWSKLYKYVEDNYSPKLKLRVSTAPRGTNAGWPNFAITAVKGLSIVWKTDRDAIDLEFAGMAGKEKELGNLLRQINATEFFIEKTGKSLSLREPIPSSQSVSFFKEFDEQIPRIDYCLRCVLKLREVANRIILLGINEFPLKKDFE